MTECCVGCFSDPFIRAVVRQHGSLDSASACEWCGTKSEPSVHVGVLTNLFRTVIHKFYVPHSSLSPLDLESAEGDGAELGSWFDDELSSAIGSRKNELVHDIVNADRDPLDPWSEIETFWYARDARLREADVRLELDLRTVEAALARYGHGLDVHGRGSDRANIDAANAVLRIRQEFSSHVYRLPAGRVFYRARLERDQALTRPRDLEPPPPDLATPGRANVAGERTLYVADRQETAVAEVRPALGDRLVFADLVLQREARVLALASVPNEEYEAFEQCGGAGPSAVRLEPESWLVEIERRRSRWSLGDRFARPIRPDDTRRDYLLTQYIARVVRDMGLDGIAYPSAQLGAPSEGFNYLFFDPFIATPGTIWRTEVVRVEVRTRPPKPVGMQLTCVPR